MDSGREQLTVDSGQSTTRNATRSIAAVSADPCPLTPDPCLLDWAGESLTLLPERVVWWPARGTVIVADLHLGKPAAFRAGGVPVPESVTDFDLDRLSGVLERRGAERLVVLGDLFHAPTGLTPETLDRVALWRERHADLRVVLVRGNHDRGWPAAPRRGPVAERRPTQAGPVVERRPTLGIEVLDPPLVEPPFAFAHEPEARDGLHAMAGHLHPCVRLVGPAGSTLRAPCFWFSSRTCVLPAFGTFTGCARVRPAPGDRVFLVGPDRVQEAAAAGPPAIGAQRSPGGRRGSAKMTRE